MAKPKSARKQPLTESQKAGLGKGLILKHQKAVRKAIEKGGTKR